ncbi:MAG: alpha-amylase [Candidatus Bathyarchaeota archaeon]|nr:alpha-amylase [Candidatus Bathyarchaeota archaeon]
MTDICLIFEVHQPFRINRRFHFDLVTSPGAGTDLFELYFDGRLNKEVFDRIARGCYLPANEVILNQIEQFKKEKKRFKVAYSLSGVFIEQCEMWNQDVIESFKQLAESGCIEFLDQTYYHSLASLFDSDLSEFIEQIEQHRETIKSLFHYEPRVFENTECIYNNKIARIAENLGYEAVITEGLERILGWRAPNYIYKAKDSSIRVLLRNYLLTDDVGFRFTSRDWDQWPISADKYANWLAAITGQVINIFMDYETLGEHYRRESGILEFLKWLPVEISKWRHLSFCTPSEVVARHEPVDEIDVPENETISWADTERDISAWLGNSLQSISFDFLKELEPLARGIENKELLKMWRYLQTSDHLYYMSTKKGGSGDVHSTFNPYNSPGEAFITYVGILSDLQSRFQIELEKPEFRHKRILRLLPADKGFTFFHDFARPTGLTARSLHEFLNILEAVDEASIKFHMGRGDFERWLDQVLGDEDLAREVSRLAEIGNGELLRRNLSDKIQKRIRELEKLSTKRVR